MDGDRNEVELEMLKYEKDVEVLENTLKDLEELLANANQAICQKDDVILELSKKVQRSMNLKKNRKERSEVPEKDAILILPEEIWRMILDLVSDPNDLWNLCNTCQLFEDILHQWKIGWMFQQTVPHLYRHLPGSKILECRRMCKSWNGTVLNFLDNHPSLRPHTGHVDPRLVEFVNPLKEKELFKRNVIQITSTGAQVPFLNDADFLSVFPSPRQNPFIGRYVVLRVGQGEYMFADSVTENEERINDLILRKAIKFLEHFGKEIWYLAIQFIFKLSERSRESVRDFITRRIFKLVPNLRKLRIQGPRQYGNILEFNPSSCGPAPELESLETSNANIPLVQSLSRRYHIQLRKLDVIPEIWREIRHLYWANLTELHLDLIMDNDDVLSLQNVRMPNLTKLGLKIYAIFAWTFTFDRLLEVIHSLSSSSKLNTLRLVGHSWNDNGVHDAFRKLKATRNKPAPASLKTLEVDHGFSTGALSYDFLIRCFPVVENLHLFFENPPGAEPRGEIDLMPQQEIFGRNKLWLSLEKQEDIIQVNKYLEGGNMYESNIWEYMLQLKVFSFQCDVFTRWDYEEYSRKMKGNNVVASESK